MTFRKGKNSAWQMFTLKQEWVASDYVKWMTNKVLSYSFFVKWQKRTQYQLLLVLWKGNHGSKFLDLEGMEVNYIVICCRVIKLKGVCLQVMHLTFSQIYFFKVGCVELCINVMQSICILYFCLSQSLVYVLQSYLKWGWT